MNPDSLYAKPGEPITPKWNALVSAIKGDQTVTGANVTVKQTPTGKHVSGVGEIRVDFPFSVGLGVGEVTVSVGTVNNDIPFVGETRLDGRTADGELDPRGTPRLKLDSKRGSDNRSFISIRVRSDGDFPDSAKDPETLQIVHIASDHEPDEGEGFKTLAIIYWQDKAPGRVLQIVRSHLQWTFYPAKSGRPSFQLMSSV